MQIRSERASDIGAIHRINQEAFGTDAEARIVHSVRSQARPVISLVADDGGALVGHILFSPVTLERTSALVMGLAPMSVVQSRQRQGIGSTLVKEGLAACRVLGAVGVVVIGHPEFYPRFGFLPGSRLGLKVEFEVPDEAFMALELVEHALRPHGLVRYHAAFSEG